MADEPARVAVAAGAEIWTRSQVASITPDAAGGGLVTLADGTSLIADTIGVNCAPVTLRRLLGERVAS